MNRTRTQPPRRFEPERELGFYFRRAVERFPDRVACDNGREQITFRALNRRAIRLANILQAQGIAAGSVVGICVGDVIDLATGIVGVTLAGGIYLPLDPSHPAARREFMIGECGTRLILCDERCRELFAGGPVPVLGMEAQDFEAAPRESTLPEAPSGEAPLYIMYSSGSTGRPKGIVIPHRAVARLVVEPDYVEIRPTDRIAQLSNIAFDASTFEIWGALLNGACLVGVDKPAMLSPAHLKRQIAGGRVSILFLTTAFFNGVARTVPDAFAGLSALLTGGERADPESFRRVLQAGPPERLLHVYGPTENTTFSAWKQIQQLDPGAADVPLGRAIRGTEAYVLDHELRAVGDGVKGELYLGGRGLALGYWNAPELTRERFVDVGVGGRTETLYRTGDLVHRNRDGELVFNGRLDRQIKLRGFRIELEEIEASLLKDPVVTDAAVLLREDVPGSKRLVAYLTVNPGADPSPEAFKAALRKWLPEYMIPSLFVLLPQMPMSATGKIERSRLPAPVELAGDRSGRNADARILSHPVQP